MSLPARQRCVIDNMEIALRAGDPRLASMFAIFGRLHAGEPVEPERLAPRGRLRWPRPGSAVYAVVVIPVVFAMIALGALFGGGRNARTCEVGHPLISSSPLVNRPACQLTGNTTTAKSIPGPSGPTAGRTAGVGQSACAVPIPRPVAWAGIGQPYSALAGPEATTAGPSGICLQWCRERRFVADRAPRA
jgi:hypothetical protein